jgi:NAD(P)-dependent dehydrogenase (short-subunit alcohol dehydrogenase family)
MGFHLTQQLANHGAKVYLASRSGDSAKVGPASLIFLACIDAYFYNQEAISRMEAENPKLQGQNRVVFLHLDLGNLKGTQCAAEQYLSLEPRLDILSERSLFHKYAHKLLMQE